MSANRAVVQHGGRMMFVCSVGVGLAANLASREAAAAPPEIGGHVGVATPLVTLSKETTSISDQFTLLTPIGVTAKLGGRFAVDFEVVVVNPVSPPGTTGLVIDPGIVYNWGTVATGLRLAFQTNANTNVGLIPLVNMPLADLGGSTWFIEAAFPTFVQSVADESPPPPAAPATGHHAQMAFNVVLHTGIGF